MKMHNNTPILFFCKRQEFFSERFFFFQHQERFVCYRKILIMKKTPTISLLIKTSERQLICFLFCLHFKPKSDKFKRTKLSWGRIVWGRYSTGIHCVNNIELKLRYHGNVF